MLGCASCRKEVCRRAFRVVIINLAEHIFIPKVCCAEFCASASCVIKLENFALELLHSTKKPIFLILNSFITVLVVMAGWTVIEYKPSQYFAAFLIMSGLLNGIFSALDGKNPKDYCQRVEPSVQGGAKMAKLIVDAVLAQRPDGGWPRHSGGITSSVKRRHDLNSNT